MPKATNWLGVWDGYQLCCSSMHSTCAYIRRVLCWREPEGCIGSRADPIKGFSSCVCSSEPHRGSSTWTAGHWSYNTCVQALYRRCILGHTCCVTFSSAACALAVFCVRTTAVPCHSCEQTTCCSAPSSCLAESPAAVSALASGNLPGMDQDSSTERSLQATAQLLQTTVGQQLQGTKHQVRHPTALDVEHDGRDASVSPSPGAGSQRNSPSPAVSHNVRSKLSTELLVNCSAHGSWWLDSGRVLRCCLQQPLAQHPFLLPPSRRHHASFCWVGSRA
jgi:hypothetical protein